MKSVSILSFAFALISTGSAFAAGFSPNFITCHTTELAKKFGTDAFARSEHCRKGGYQCDTVTLSRAGIEWVGELEMAQNTQLHIGALEKRAITATIRFDRASGRMNWEISEKSRMQFLGGVPNSRPIGTAEGVLNGAMSEGADTVIRFDIVSLGVEAKPMWCTFLAEKPAPEGGDLL